MSRRLRWSSSRNARRVNRAFEQGGGGDGGGGTLDLLAPSASDSGPESHASSADAARRTHFVVDVFSMVCDGCSAEPSSPALRERFMIYFRLPPTDPTEESRLACNRGCLGAVRFVSAPWRYRRPVVVESRIAFRSCSAVIWPFMLALVVFSLVGVSSGSGHEFASHVSLCPTQSIFFILILAGYIILDRFRSDRRVSVALQVIIKAFLRSYRESG